MAGGARHQFLPMASFVERPVPERPRDPEENRSEATVSVAPVRAPTDFRTLPPSTVQKEANPPNEGSPAITAVGSGVPMKKALGRSDFFSRCGWCGGEDLRCIANNSWSMYSHYESTYFYRWEGECVACGLFTQANAMTLS